MTKCHYYQWRGVDGGIFGLINWILVINLPSLMVQISSKGKGGLVPQPQRIDPASITFTLYDRQRARDACCLLIRPWVADSGREHVCYIVSRRAVDPLPVDGGFLREAEGLPATGPCAYSKYYVVWNLPEWFGLFLEFYDQPWHNIQQVFINSI